MKSKPFIGHLFFYLTISLALISCNQESIETSTKNGRIDIGTYSFQFPKDFELIKEQGDDSYVGKVSNGKIDFQFDFGYYSNSLDRSVEEYISEDVWKWNALGSHQLLPEGDVTGLTDDVHLIGYTTSDSINCTLRYLFHSDTLTYELQVPKEKLNVKIDIDTIDNVMYKFVRSTNYVGLYAKDLGSFNKSINSHQALSIIATELSPEETEQCFELLHTCKLIKR